MIHFSSNTSLNDLFMNQTEPILYSHWLTDDPVNYSQLFGGKDHQWITNKNSPHKAMTSEDI